MLSGRLDFDRLPADDEEAIAHLTAVKGIGRWTAEIYLLFAEGRPDIFPAGDLAVQIEIGNIMGMDGKPTEKAIRALAEPWRPTAAPPPCSPGTTAGRAIYWRRAERRGGCDDGDYTPGDWVLASCKERPACADFPAVVHSLGGTLGRRSSVSTTAAINSPRQATVSAYDWRSADRIDAI